MEKHYFRLGQKNDGSFYDPQNELSLVSGRIVEFTTNKPLSPTTQTALSGGAIMELTELEVEQLVEQHGFTVVKLSYVNGGVDQPTESTEGSSAEGSEENKQDKEQENDGGKDDSDGMSGGKDDSDGMSGGKDDSDGMSGGKDDEEESEGEEDDDEEEDELDRTSKTGMIAAVKSLPNVPAKELEKLAKKSLDELNVLYDKYSS